MVKKAAKAAVKAVTKEAEKKETVKAEEVKAEPVKAEPVKAEEVKTEPVKAEAVKEEPVKAAPVKEEAKKAPAKKTAEKASVKKEINTSVVVQFGGQEVSAETVVENVKKAFEAEGHRVSAIKELQVYVKPEEYAAYYVINQKYTGKVNLF